MDLKNLKPAEIRKILGIVSEVKFDTKTDKENILNNTPLGEFINMIANSGIKEEFQKAVEGKLKSIKSSLEFGTYMKEVM